MRRSISSPGLEGTLNPRDLFGGAGERALRSQRNGTRTNLLAYWRILNRRKGTLILIAVVGAVLGYFVTLPQTPIYQVRTSLEIVGLNQNFLNMKESNPLNEGGGSVDAGDIQTQIKILQSESLIERVMTKLHANTVPLADPAAPTDGWRQILNLPNPEVGNSAQQAYRYAKDHYKVRASGQTRMIEVTVDSLSPESASTFANTLTSEFIEQNLEARWKTTEHTGEWLTRQLDDIRVRLSTLKTGCSGTPAKPTSSSR
ncbi:MAG: Wzz/FepE/Etk N-terminal domain-containing protein [Acidobacteriota bacterium]